MARQRRGGFRPPEIRGTLGTLIRTTLEQAGVVRDAIERSAREGRSRLDEARTHRRRKDALAELGELVLDLVRRGEIDLAELPEARDLVRLLDDLDGGDPGSDEPDDRIAQPPTRGRFDARARPGARAPSRARDPDPDPDDDGTVSATRGGGSSGAAARSWSPPKPAAPQRVWRPSLTDDEPPPEPPDARTARSAGSLPRDPHRKGGVQFDDDEDLADYMHPDDVPPKPPSDGDR